MSKSMKCFFCHRDETEIREIITAGVQESFSEEIAVFKAEIDAKKKEIATIGRSEAEKTLLEEVSHIPRDFGFAGVLKGQKTLENMKSQKTVPMQLRDMGELHSTLHNREYREGLLITALKDLETELTTTEEKIGALSKTLEAEMRERAFSLIELPLPFRVSRNDAKAQVPVCLICKRYRLEFKSQMRWHKIET
jgi:hypothetical protein